MTRPDASVVAALFEARPELARGLARVLCSGRAGDGRHELLRVVATASGPCVLAWTTRTAGLREDHRPRQELTAAWLDDLSVPLSGRCRCGETAGFTSSVIAAPPAGDLRAELVALVGAGRRGVQTLELDGGRAEVTMTVRSEAQRKLLRERLAGHSAP